MDDRDTSPRGTTQPFDGGDAALLALLDLPHTLVLVLDSTGRILRFNRACLALTGYSEEEILGRPLHDLLPPGTEVAPFFSGSTPFLLSWLTGEGEEVQIEWRCHPLEVPGTKDPGVLALGLDVTGLDRLAPSLEESEKRFLDVLYASEDAMGLLGEDNRFLDCNDAAARLHGYESREELLRKRVHPGEIISPPRQPDGRDSVEKANEMIRLALDQGTNRFEWTHRRRDGSDFPAEVFLTALVTGGRRLVHAVWRDISERKRAEEALRYSADRYRCLFENTGTAMLIVNAAGLIEEANLECLKITGYSREQLVNTHWRSYVAPESLPMMEDYFRHRFFEPERAPESYEARLINASGETRTALVSVGVIARERMQLVVSVQDITERRLLEEQLVAKEKRLQHILAMSPACIYSLDPETFAPLWVSPNITELLGYPLEETLRQNFWAANLHPDDREAALARAREIIPRGELTHEYRFRRKNGETIWIHDQLLAIRDRSGKVTEIFGSWIDITARKEAEVERERLMAAITQSDEVVMITDPNGTIQFVNPAFEQTTGYSTGEAVGQNPRILKSGRQDQAFYAELWGTITAGRTWKGRMVNKRKDGTFYTDETSITPVRDARGKIVNFVAVKRDITEHIRLTEQFRQAQKMESIGRLAGGVAHDYNNMLSVIIGNAEFAREKIAPDDPVQADLQDILTAAKRSADITRQLLAFARRQTIAPEVLDLNEQVEALLKMLRRLLGENIDLRWEPAPGLWPVMLDPAQVDQVLANLCVNARDAITGVGKITIETENVIFDREYCAGHMGTHPGDFVLLAVTDSGCGMDAATREKIFEPFFTTKAEGRGTGLGLATVYGIVKQNNGFINVYSEPGEGTTFKIYLPRHAGETAKERAATAETIPMGRGETILLVEDEPTLLKMGRTMLERLGYTVLTASSPSEALAIAGEAATDIHLLISDVIMPEMNGRELADTLIAARPDMKVLFMSGYTANAIAHHGVLDPGISFLQKPFSRARLARAVRRELDGDGK
ncbi:MAG: hypothetical protein Kow0089_15040 [Desulfobulbaceae bacterium]